MATDGSTTYTPESSLIIQQPLMDAVRQLDERIAPEPQNEASEKTQKAQAVLKRLDEATIEKLGILAQGVRAAHDDNFIPLTLNAAQQSGDDLITAAYAIHRQEVIERTKYTAEQLPEILTQQVVKSVNEDLGKGNFGRAA